VAAVPNPNFLANDTIAYPERIAIASARLKVLIKNTKPTKIEIVITSAKEPKNATNPFNLLTM
jgi:hypothetical protein